MTPVLAKLVLDNPADLESARRLMELAAGADGVVISASEGVLLIDLQAFSELARNILPLHPVLRSEEVEQTKSLVASGDLPAGHSLRREDLIEKPPLRGITARHLEFVIGKQILYDVKQDEPITFGILGL